MNNSEKYQSNRGLYVKPEDIPEKEGLLSVLLYSMILGPLALFAIVVLLGAL